MLKPWRWPLFLSGFFLLSQAVPLASPVCNSATEFYANGFSLTLPFRYVVFAPFCGIADRLTLLSFHQVLVTFVYVIVAGFLIWGWRRWFVSLFLFIPFLAWTALISRPVARLVAKDPDVLLIDFHSHSQVSHDGRPDFTAEENMRWHRDQGYNASFITDHNRIESSQKAKTLSRSNWRETGYRSLEGEEVSLWKTHLAVLGVHERIDNQPYDSDPAKVSLFIKAMKRKGLPVIAALPEYWWYHWLTPGTSPPPPLPEGEGRSPRLKNPLPVGEGTATRVAGGEVSLGNVNDFIRWGISGFEVVNSAPKALDFPPDYKRQIIELCRQNNLFMTGISDTHGWGYTTAVWNAMRIPGWQEMDPDRLESAVLSHLRTERFRAVEVLERVRYNPESLAGLLFSPIVNAGLHWRSLQPVEAVSWAAWIWLTFGLNTWAKKQKLKKSSSVKRKTP